MVRHARKPAKSTSPVKPTIEVVHARVPGRVRFRLPFLRGNPTLGQLVTARLTAAPHIESVAVNCRTGSILVHHGPKIRCETVSAQIAEAMRQAQHDQFSDISDAVHTATADDMQPSGAIKPCHVAKMSWHNLSIHRAAANLGVDIDAGLHPEEVARRLTAVGPNVLQKSEPRSFSEILAEQLTSLPAEVLGASAILSLLTGGGAEAIAIAGAVLTNALIASRTEVKAEKIIDALSDFRAKPVAVRRAGRKQIVDPKEIVPGDLFFLEMGTLVPADGRLVVADDLTINEAALTGEARPVRKTAKRLGATGAVLAERTNSVLRGTAVTGGSGTAIATATGMSTQIGRVQSLMDTLQPPPTPIQRQLSEVERELIVINGGICGLIFAIGLLRGHALLPLIRSAISLAVAAIPEGLPAVATTTLAVGIQEMRRRKVLVRKLEAVETLGAINTLGLDKTGTLTDLSMSLAAVQTNSGRINVKAGRFLLNGKDLCPRDKALLDRLLQIVCLCSEARAAGEGDKVEVRGSPTEVSLLNAGLMAGVDILRLRTDFPIKQSAGRSEVRKRMSTLHAMPTGHRLLAVKGDPEQVLKRSSYIRTGQGLRKLTSRDRATIRTANQYMANEALRVLGVASSDDGDPQAESDLTWLGLVGLENPIRFGVRPAIKSLQRAGIRTVMITGDQSGTAAAIARNLNLTDSERISVLEAGQMRGPKPEVLSALADRTDVFSRASPVDKLQIVQGLQDHGHVVGMTGDGINDGPALRAANVGIAIGDGGSDVAKQVADIVLAEDDLQGVIEAIRLGRATHANIRKVLKFLISTNAAETTLMLSAAVADWPAPISPLQLLFLNFATDVLPAIALGLDPPEQGIMSHPPRDPEAPILSAREFRELLLDGTIMGLGGLGAFILGGGRTPAGAAKAGTIAFHGLTAAQLLHAFKVRAYEADGVVGIRRPANPKLYGAVASGLAMQAVVQLTPPLRNLFKLAPLGSGDALKIAAATAATSAGVALASRARRHVVRTLAPRSDQ